MKYVLSNGNTTIDPVTHIADMYRNRLLVIQDEIPENTIGLQPIDDSLSYSEAISKFNKIINNITYSVLLKFPTASITKNSVSVVGSSLFVSLTINNVPKTIVIQGQ